MNLEAGAQFRDTLLQIFCAALDRLAMKFLALNALHQRLMRWQKLLSYWLRRQLKVLTWHTTFKIVRRLLFTFDLGHFHAEYEAAALADSTRFSDNNASPHFNDLLDDSEAEPDPLRVDVSCAVQFAKLTEKLS